MQEQEHAMRPMSAVVLAACSFGANLLPNMHVQEHCQTLWRTTMGDCDPGVSGGRHAAAEDLQAVKVIPSKPIYDLVTVLQCKSFYSRLLFDRNCIRRLKSYTPATPLICARIAPRALADLRNLQF